MPALLWLWLTPLAALVVLASSFLDWPAICRVMLRRDDYGGVLELGTPLVLLPGIWAGFAALGRLRGAPRPRFLRIWVALWALACVYFAGEEVSWGQWFFGWETPEAWRRFNDQGETNLHNVSNFLDQVPRAFVEVFILVGGLILPLWREVTGRALDPDGIWYWVLPTRVGILTAAIWLAAQIIDQIEPPMNCRFHDSELREFYIATFLGLYLVSIRLRAQGLGAGAPEPAPGPLPEDRPRD